jgi:hypothetical protein
VARPFAARRIGIKESVRGAKGCVCDRLAELEPDRGQSALAYAVRTQLPLVQVPSGGVWGYSGKVPFTTAEKWLGRELSGSEDPRGLVFKYLAAFGPATVRDIQMWSGMTQLKESVEKIKVGLRIFRDERGNEQLDLPDRPGERRRSSSNPSSACPGRIATPSAKKARVSSAFWRNRRAPRRSTSSSCSRPRMEPRVRPVGSNDAGERIVHYRRALPETV